MEKVREAEVIVYATPIYYYEMCGQLLDRFNPLYAIRDIYRIQTPAKDEESAFEKVLNMPMMR